MSKTSGEHLVLPNCAAVELSRDVDELLNAGAIAEAKDATDAPQESDDQGDEGSKYLTGPVVFTERSIAYGVYNGVAKLLATGMVTASKCPISGKCELEWFRAHPEAYVNEAGEPTAHELPCGAEAPCHARLKFEVDEAGTPDVKVIRGACAVALKDTIWRGTGESAWLEAEFIPPERIAVFDGEGSGREAPDPQL